MRVLISLHRRSPALLARRAPLHGRSRDAAHAQHAAPPAWLRHLVARLRGAFRAAFAPP